MIGYAGSKEQFMTRIKICGIREAGDALAACQAGADFVGLVFVPGRRRRLDEGTALSIVSILREKMDTAPKLVGLFADQPLEDVHHIVRTCGLDMVQLCGSESLEYCGQVEVPVIKVLHVSNSLAVEEAVAVLSRETGSLQELGHLITLDRKVEGLEGGTGRSFDWDIAKALARSGFPFLLAGGLTPENVAMAVRTVNPWGVDVSSGVETAGVKDVQKISAFIATVRGTAPGEDSQQE